jgi:hypothetical protein
MATIASSPDIDSRTTTTTTSSQQVSWWDVHLFVDQHLAAVGDWPMIGSPEWCQLPDDHPQRWAAILSAAEMWAELVERNQEARAVASRDVEAAQDWPAIAREIRQRNSVYIRRAS